MILISVNDIIYEVSRYIPNHPGEGIRNIYLRKFHRKDCTSLFEKFHNTNEADELLIKSNNNNFKITADGISMVCPFFFKRKIPKYFYFIEEDMLNENLEKIFLEKKNSFILRRNLDALKNSLIITYYDTNEQSYIHNKIIKTDDHWEGSISIENQTFHYKETTVEKIIDKMMIGNNFDPL